MASKKGWPLKRMASKEDGLLARTFRYHGPERLAGGVGTDGEGGPPRFPSDQAEDRRTIVFVGPSSTPVHARPRCLFAR